MKKIRFIIPALIGAVVAFGSCKEKSPSDGPTDEGYGYDFTEVLAVYTDDVILPTYADLKSKAWTLYNAVQAYAAAQNQTNLDAVCAAWRAARIPWERSEACLYGPAEILSLDPSLDSWPLDKGEIDNIINGSGTITETMILDENLHGFHTIEYLIFDGGNPKTIDLSARELQYLVVATEYLRDDCIKLWAAWNGADGIGSEDKAVLDGHGFNAASYNFAYNFKNAVSSSGVTLVTKDDAIDNIVEGCASIADEVGNQKISAPRDLAAAGEVEQARLEVESWYSFNSIDDFANNIISIRNSYFGGLGKTAANKSEHSLSTFVASKNADLDSEITAAIDKAYTAINSGMQRPFRDHLTGSKVDAAIDACVDLQLSLEKIKSLKD